mgnify:CR=1 FL=1
MTLSARLIEIHGQHGSLRLLDPSTQTAFLDRYAGAEHLAAVAAYAESYQRATAARRALRRLEDDARDRERELDLLRYQVEEIRSVAAGAWRDGCAPLEENRLAHGERLLELAAAAEEILSAEGGVAEGSASVVRGLDRIVELDAAARGSGGSGARPWRRRQLSSVAMSARTARDSRRIRPGSQSIRERIGELKGLQRKYDRGMPRCVAFLDEAAARILSLAGPTSVSRSCGPKWRRRPGGDHARGTGHRRPDRRRERRSADALAERASRTSGCRVLRSRSRSDRLPEPGPSGAERVELRFRAGPGSRG